MKHKKRIRVAALLLTLIFISAGISAAPVEAADAADTEYIIKRNDGAARDQNDQSPPFEVVSEAEMIRLRDAGLLEWYEPDGVMTFDDEPTPDWYAEEKWDLAMIGADAAFEMGTLGQGVRIGVVDSGINPHADLAGRLTEGCNYIEGANETDTADRYGHGTLVAGLIAGRSENGAIGAATEAELVPLKVTDGKAILVSTVCRAIYGGVDDYDCDVLNLSLGINSDFQALREAVDYAEEQGVLVIAAVGNNGTAVLRYPAAYENVIGVGAVDETGAVYYHSNQNDSVFLTAPGANVKTTGQRGGYTNASGTSFAVPHVTAAAAVLRGIDPELTLSAVRKLLSQTATDCGEEGWDRAYGWGIVNIGESVFALTTAKADPSYTVPEGLVAMVGWTLADVKLPSGWTWNDPTQVLSEAGAQTFPATFTPEDTEHYNVVENVMLTVTAKTMRFVDVPAGSYYEDAVCWAVLHDVTAGTGDTTFTPNGVATRAQVVTFLWRAAGMPEPEALKSIGRGEPWLFADEHGSSLQSRGGGNPFADVKAGEYYYKAVLWAVENEITDGTSAKTFSPNAACTRAQAVTFLWRTEGKPNPTSTNNSFTDVTGGYYYDAVLWAVEKNITAGTSATTFSPNATCTRGQIVTFLYRAFAE